MRRRRHPWGLLGCLAALLTAAPAHAAATPARAAAPLGSGLVALDAPGAPTAGPLRLRGRANRDERLTVVVHLAARNRAELRRVADAVADPRSPRYRRHLTPAQARRRFAPLPSTVAAVRAWARRAGLRVEYVPANRKMLVLTGTVGRFERAFDTRLGIGLRAPSSPPRLPASIARHVLHVAGLADDPVARPAAASTPARGKLYPPPCSRWWGQQVATDRPAAYGRHHPWAPCGYSPAQLRSAYEVDDLLSRGIDGTGQRIAVVMYDSSPTIESDLMAYSARHGLPFADLTLQRPPVTQDPIWDRGIAHLEQTLDLEAIHGIAPRAQLVYQQAAGSHWRFVMLAINDVVANARAQAISLSLTLVGEQNLNSNDADEEVFMLAAASGIGIYAGAGDNGDSIVVPGGRERQPNWPSASAYVTGVGGTTLAVDERGERLFETAWGVRRSTRSDTGAWSPEPPGEFVYGTGGGTSHTRLQPDYQRAAVPESLAYYWRDRPSTFFPVAVMPGRVVPDVAADADPYTGLMIGQTLVHPGGDERYTEYVVGGTSLAAPLFAAIMLLADHAVGRPHGFANPALYALAGRSAFHDVVRPAAPVAVVAGNYVNGVDGGDGIRTSLATTGEIGTLVSQPGYDDSTGLGTPDAAALAAALVDPARQPPPPPPPSASPTPAAVPGPGSAQSPPTAGKPRRRPCARRITIVLPRRAGRIVRVALHADGRLVRRQRGRDLRVVRYTRRGDRLVRLRVAARTARGRLLHVRRRIPRCRA